MPTSGYMNNRLKVYDVSEVATQFGTDLKLTEVGKFWANVRYQNGSQILRQGDIMMAQTIVITCRRHTFLNDRVKIEYEGRLYRITSFNCDYHRNSVTMVCEKYEA